MAVVQLANMEELKRAIRALGPAAEQAVIRAMRDTARFGVAAVLRTSAQTKPRPKAYGTYERSWLVHKLTDGATISNSALHSLFVERGRRPGRRPPLSPILEWVYQKRLARRPRSKKPLSGKRNEPGGPGNKPPGPKRPKKRRTGSKRKWAVTDAHAFAEKVRWKIAKKGTPGRFILRRTMPIIAKRASRETKRAIAKLARHPPTGRGG